MAVVGFTQGTAVVVKSLVFDNYPLDNYEETKCNLGMPTREVPLEKNEIEPISEEDRKDKQDVCISGLEHARKVKQVEDITNSISLLIAGLVLAKIFKS